MTSSTIKQEIHQLIDQVQDNDVLQVVYDILNKGKAELALRAEMNRRTQAAEEDIKQGRVYTPDEFKSKINEFLLSKRR
jgi:predicted phage gp36 major capsid-like protein